MKVTQLRLGAALAAVVAVSAVGGVCRAAGTLTIDEFGTVTFTPVGGGTITPPAAFAPDAGPGGLAAVITYGLPAGASPIVGDLILNEPGTSGQISDVIRFNPGGPFGPGVPSIPFYSDNADGSDAPGDVGLPTAFYPLVAFGTESGVEGGVQDFLYTPVAGQPGFDTAGIVTTYHIISDLPEPGSLALLGLGGVLLMRRRR